MKIVFFGTPPFAAEVLSSIVDAGIEVVCVISKPDRPKGRSGKPQPTAVKLAAQEKIPDVPLYQPEKVSSEEFKPVLSQFDADLFVVVAYGEILRQHILDMPKMGCINLHASLLPKYRGAAPIQRAIMSGEKETGVTIMHMVRKMDAGDMIRQARVPIGPDETYGEVEDKLCEVGKKLLIEVIRDFEKETISETAQDENQVTYADKIELEECEIDWGKSAKEIHDLIRGVNPFPGAWCYIHVGGVQKRLKIHSSKIVEEAEPVSDKDLIVPCGEGSLKLLIVQPEGKKAMNASDFLRGNKEIQF